MTASRVISLPHDDDESACVLIQVTSTGPKPLDVKLVGTEGEAPYATILKHDRVASLRVKNSPASESEWETILQSLFAQKPVPDIQATASVQSETSISITVRKQVQGITQRLGSIILKYDEDEAIELFQWCAAAADASAKSNEALAEATASARELETTVNELKAQLDELVAAKQDDETALLQKFRDLLNEKKVKIREQQKILASASLQGGRPQSSPQPSQSPEPQTSRRPAPSRPAKRKAPISRAESNAADEDAMDVDTKIKSEPEDSEPELDHTTEATASEASDDDDDGGNDDGNSGVRIPSNTNAEVDVEKSAPKKAAEQPPPPRSLPFARKKAPAPAPEPAPATAAAGNETDSDDEL